MRILVSFFTYLIFTATSFSQDNYQTGYVVDLKGDTIHGTINNQRWERNPLKISFRANGTTLPKEYHSTEIRSFSVQDYIYISAIVDVDISPYKISELNESSQPEYVKDTVFLQALVREDKGLYYLNDQKRKKHFYIKNNGFQSLVYKQYIIYVWASHLNGFKKMIAENSGYKEQLINYLGDCPEIQKRVLNIRYEKSSLVKLFTKYYECINRPLDYDYSGNDTKLDAGFLGGITNSTLSFKGASDYLQSGKYESSTRASLGIYFDFRLLHTKRLTISNDLYYSSLDIHGTGFWQNSASSDSVISTFNYQFIKSNNQLRVDLTNSGSLYISGGVSINFTIKEDVQIRVLNPANTEFEFKQQRVRFGYLGTIGYQFKKISTEFRAGQISLLQGGHIRELHFFLKYRLTK